MNNKIIMIVGIVLIVISIALSAVSLLMLKGALDQINGDDAISADIEGEEMTVPIAKQFKYEMTEPIIGIYQNKVDGESLGTLNVSVRTAFGVFVPDKKEEPDTDAMDALILIISENEGYLRDRISKLLSAKDYEYMSQEGIEEMLQTEILEMVKYELQSEDIVQVYFPDGILKSYR